MIYQCTAKVLNSLKIEPDDKPHIYSRLFSWQVKMVKSARRNMVYLMNDASKLSVVFYGMTAKDFKQFDWIASQGIEAVLKEMGMPVPVIRQYLEDGGKAIVTESGTPRQLGILNRAAMEAEFFLGEMMEGELLQLKLSRFQNDGLVKNDEGDYIKPSETMAFQLQKTYGSILISYDLDEIALYMFMGEHHEMEPYLNVKDGSILVLDVFSGEEEAVEWDDDYVYIPSAMLDFFGMIDDFAKGEADEAFHRDLENARGGRGAIRRIKDVLGDYPEIEERWHRYKEQVERARVQHWLKMQGLA